MRAAVLLLALAAPAAAQIPYTPLFSAEQRAVGLSLGAAQPTGTSGLSRVTGRGPSLGVDFLDYWQDWVAWGLGLDYHALGGGSDAGPPARAGKASFASLSLLARLDLLRGESWTPYLDGGVGYGLSNLKVAATAAPGRTVCADVNQPAACAQAASAQKSYAGVVVTGAAGVESFVTQGLSVFLEARYNQYRLPLSSANFSVPARRAETLSLRVGAHLWFGHSSDSSSSSS